jgi:hypothetical protein
MPGRAERIAAVERLPAFAESAVRSPTDFARRLCLGPVLTASAVLLDDDVEPVEALIDSG